MAQHTTFSQLITCLRWRRVFRVAAFYGGGAFFLFPNSSLLTAQSSGYDGATPLALQRLSGAISLDGFSDEPAWQAIEPLPLTMTIPIFEGAMTEDTEIRVAYDDDYIYVAGRMYDSDPDGIQGVDIARDIANWQNDWFGIILDNFNDNENAVSFWTNPAGLRLDVAVSNDAEGNSWWSSSWNTFWDVKTARNEDGWFAELRIPFSSLRFQDNASQVVMGLITWRYIARKGEFQIFPQIPPDWGTRSVWKISQARKVQFSGVYSRDPLYITPYALGGLDQSAALNQAGTAYGTANTPAGDFGLDVKYGLTSNLTLDLTLNTDFAQVEADNQQINLSRFSLFFPEKRLFFQERASTFDFGLGGSSRLFHSRRIGIHEGQQVPIYGGARLVGRVGNWDLGVINIQTAPLRDDNGQTTLSSENLGVARLRRQVLNPYSFVGGMVTNRMGTDGAYNYAFGLDGILRFFGEDYLTASWAQAFDSGWEEAPGPLDAGQLRLNWERRGVIGPVYNMDVIHRGDRFQPGLAFVDRTDITLFQGRAGYGWFSPKLSPLLRHLPTLSGSVYQRASTGRVESAEGQFNWYLETKRRANASLRLSSIYERLTETFNLATEANVPTGEYRFLQANVSYTMAQGELIRATGFFQGGGYYDGRRLTASITPVWKSKRFLEVSGTYRYDYITFPDRNQKYVNSIVRLSVKSSLSVATSVAGLIQYNSTINAVFVNLRLRYNPREGTDLYLVFNDNLMTRRQREEPALPFSSTRAVLLKYSITFLR